MNLHNSTLQESNSSSMIRKNSFSYQSSPSNSMDIEEEAKIESKLGSENSLQSTTQKRNSASEHHSKDSLKFCRKISALVTNHLEIKSKFCYDLLKFNADVAVCLLYLYDFKNIDLSQIISLEIECLLRLWGKLKDVLTYRKNKKICIVKKEHWDLVFDKTEAVNALKKILVGFADSWYQPVGKVILNDDGFCDAFARTLYCCNRVLSMVLALKDCSETGHSLRKLETIDNFVVLMLFPHHYPHYNHRGGKFAVECCSKCKICCSKNIPERFIEQLTEARLEATSLITNIDHYFGLYENMNLEVIFNLMKMGYSIS